MMKISDSYRSLKSFGLPWAVFLIFVSGCSTSSKNSQPLIQKNFLEYLQSHSDQIWSPSLNSETKNAILDFSHEKKLSSGATYGASVRNYDLRNKCFTDIDQDMRDLKCTRKEDVVKDPSTKNPLKMSDGKTIPLIVYLCSDGGVVRVKPEGDPTNKFRPQPHASKALRYPFNSKFENFDDERAKVDNFGNVVPKWTRDMNPALTRSKENADLIEGWADDSHTDLKICR